MKCLMVRGVLSGWSGSHNPAYTEAQIAAGTEPTTSWALTSFAGICRGYALGYGAVYMNDGDESSFLGWMNYSSGTVSSPLMNHLKQMLDIASDFSRGTRFLALTDTATDDTSLFNASNGAQSWGQMLDLLSKSYTINRASISGLESGELRYSGDKSYFNQFRGVILLLQGDGAGVSQQMANVLSAAFAQGVPFLVMQRDSIHGAASFNKIFAPLALSNSDSTWAHFDATSIGYNKSVLGAEESLTDSFLSQHPLFYTGAASFTLTNKNLAPTELNGYQGSWYFCTCTEEPELDAPDAVNGIVESPTGYFGAEQLFTRTFDVSATIVKPDDWRSTLPEGALKFDWWGNWDEPKRSQRLIHVQSAGLMYAHTSAVRDALFSYKGITYSGSRSYNILVIDRITGNVRDYRTFDVFDGSKPDGTACAEFLNALDNDVIVLVAGWDEPSRNVIGTPVEAALLRCGASSTTLRTMKYRCAYILVGIPGIGSDNGIERYTGGIDSDPTSFVSEVFDLKLNAVPALTPVMSDVSGIPHIASLKGHMDNIVFAMNVVQFLNYGLSIDVVQKFLQNVFNTISLAGKPRRILIATDKVTGSYSITDTSTTGMSDLIPVLGQLGYEVDTHDIRSYPRAEVSWFSDYCAIIFICLDSTPTGRMEPYIDAMMVAVRRGIGLFCIGDADGLSSNMHHLLNYYDLKNVSQAHYNPSAFEIATQYQKHGSPLLSGMEGMAASMPNDLNYGGTLTQCLGYIPVAVSSENLEIYGYNNLKRTARVRYQKKLDRFDALRQFKVQGFAKLTDVRFKKLDMSGSDDFWLHFGFPSVEALDQPDISIGDTAVTENDGSYIFSTRWLDKVTSAIETDPNGNSYQTNSIINTPGNTVIGSVFLNTFGVSGSSHTWNKQRYQWELTYRIYVPASGDYLFRFAADDNGSWWLDGTLIAGPYQDDQNYLQGEVSISAGWHEIKLHWSQSASGSSFRKNPEAIALAIHASFAGGYGAYTDVVAELPVKLSDPVSVSHPITVDYKTVDGTAIAGKDYVATSGTLVFEQGDYLKTIRVPLIGDAVNENVEGFTVQLSNNSRGSIVDAVGSVTITDNDPVDGVVDRWWIPAGSNRTFLSSNSKWGPGKTLVMYLMDFHSGPFMANNEFAAGGYRRVVVDWNVDGTKTFYYPTVAPNGVVANKTIATFGSHNLGIFIKPDGIHFCWNWDTATDAASFAAELPLPNIGSYTSALYIYAYVQDYGSAAKPDYFFMGGNVTADGGITPCEHWDYSIAYVPSCEEITQSGQYKPTQFFNGEYTHQLSRDVLYKIQGRFSYYGAGAGPLTDYICIPTLVDPAGIKLVTCGIGESYVFYAPAVTVKAGWCSVSDPSRTSLSWAVRTAWVLNDGAPVLVSEQTDFVVTQVGNGAGF